MGPAADSTAGIELGRDAGLWAVLDPGMPEFLWWVEEGWAGLAVKVRMDKTRWYAGDGGGMNDGRGWIMLYVFRVGLVVRKGKLKSWRCLDFQGW